MSDPGTYSRRGWLTRFGLAAGALGVRTAGAQSRIPVAPRLSTDSAFRRVTLEVSLKPFYDTTPSAIEHTCAEIFRSWAPLLHHCDASAVMLWSADGSEILNYTGQMQ